MTKEQIKKINKLLKEQEAIDDALCYPFYQLACCSSKTVIENHVQLNGLLQTKISSALKDRAKEIDQALKELGVEG